MTSTTVASSLGTERTTCGRASPTAMTISAARTSSGGTKRRRPGSAVTSPGKRAGLPKTARLLASAAIEHEVGPHGDRHQREERQCQRPGQAHRLRLRRKAASVRSQSPSVESTTWAAPHEASVRATASRSAAAAAANRSRSLESFVSTRRRRPLSASISHSSPTGDSSCSRGSRTSTARRSWRAASPSSGRCQSSGPRKSEMTVTSESRRAMPLSRRSVAASGRPGPGLRRISPPTR